MIRFTLIISSFFLLATAFSQTKWIPLESKKIGGVTAKRSLLINLESGDTTQLIKLYYSRSIYNSNNVKRIHRASVRLNDLKDRQQLIKDLLAIKAELYTNTSIKYPREGYTLTSFTNTSNVRLHGNSGRNPGPACYVYLNENRIQRLVEWLRTQNAY
jgi:hypothetical protein